MWMRPWCQRTGPSPWGLNIVQGHLAFTVPLLQVGTRAELQSTRSFSSSSGFLHPMVAGKEGRTLGRATPCYQKVQKVGCKAVLKMKLQMFTRRLCLRYYWSLCCTSPWSKGLSLRTLPMYYCLSPGLKYNQMRFDTCAAIEVIFIMRIMSIPFTPSSSECHHYDPFCSLCPQALPQTPTTLLTITTNPWFLNLVWIDS